jgi:hypothetical protein
VVEPLFAETKDWHGMRRFRLRRLGKVTIEALLIASGQNVKRLLAFGGCRPKKLAQSAALRPPAATGREISRAREHRAERSWLPTRAFFNSLDRLWDTTGTHQKTHAPSRIFIHHRYILRSGLSAL